MGSGESIIQGKPREEHLARWEVVKGLPWSGAVGLGMGASERQLMGPVVVGRECGWNVWNTRLEKLGLLPRARGVNVDFTCGCWLFSVCAPPCQPPILYPTLTPILCFAQALRPSAWRAFPPSPLHIPGRGPFVATASARYPFLWLQLSLVLVTKLPVFAPQA